MRACPGCLIFIYETGTNTKMTRVYGRSRKGQRLKACAPFRQWRHQTLIAGLSCDGLVAPWGIPGAMDREAFNTYIEQVLAPALEPGTVVTLDNLSVHKSPEATAVLKARGCWFLFLPSYSPDLNPIEMAFAKLKAHLRSIGARTFDQVIEAIGEICNMFTPDKCWNYFRATGYTS